MNCPKHHCNTKKVYLTMNMNILWANPILLAYPFVKEQWRKIICFLGFLLLGIFLFVAITGFQKFDYPEICDWDFFLRWSRDVFFGRSLKSFQHEL